jgi:hypothetical protein
VTGLLERLEQNPVWRFLADVHLVVWLIGIAGSIASLIAWRLGLPRSKPILIGLLVSGVSLVGLLILRLWRRWKAKRPDLNLSNFGHVRDVQMVDGATLSVWGINVVNISSRTKTFARNVRATVKSKGVSGAAIAYEPWWFVYTENGTHPTEETAVTIPSMDRGRFVVPILFSSGDRFDRFYAADSWPLRQTFELAEGDWTIQVRLRGGGGVWSQSYIVHLRRGTAPSGRKD